MEKLQLHHNFTTWRHHQFFWCCFVSHVKFSYWSRLHVNIITCSGVMIIFFCKRLTRNPEIGNTSIWVLPNIWRLKQVRDTKFGLNVSNKMLLNAATCQGYSFYHFWAIKVKLPPTQIRVKPWKYFAIAAFCNSYIFTQTQHLPFISAIAFFSWHINHLLKSHRDSWMHAAE